MAVVTPPPSLLAEALTLRETAGQIQPVFGKAVAGKGAVCPQVLAANGVVGKTVPVKAVAAAKGVELELPEVAKGVAAKGTAVKGTAVAGNAAVVTGKTVTATGTNAIAAKAGSVAGIAKGTAVGGTIWSGTGPSLGLGLGLGVWGPVLLLGSLAAIGVGIYGYLRNKKTQGDLSEVIS